MMKAENGKRVKVQFVGRLEDGTVFGESSAEKPLEFTVGKERLIPGFVQAVCGMEPGEKKSVHVEPEDGFGTYDPGKVLNFKRDRLAKNEPLETGMNIALEDATGHQLVGRVNSFDDTSVILDLNHPLAGERLQFDIQLQAVA